MYVDPFSKSVSYRAMIRLIPVLLCAVLLSSSMPAAAQKPAHAETATPAISSDQARVALDVLNDPAKRAAFAATLNAIVKSQPAAGPASAGEPGKPAVQATVEGLAIPLAPDSLGAQVLVSAAGFVNRLGNEAVAAMDTVQSLPLLYGWTVVMLTNPVARDLLLDVGWRVAIALACAVAVEYLLRRAMRRPMGGLEALAPTPLPAEAVETPEPVADDAVARAEVGDVEPLAAVGHAPSASTFLRRVPLVLARLVLDLVPAVGIGVVGHLIAGSSIGGQTVSRLIILAVIDAYVLSAALICVARMVLSPEAPRLRLFHLRDESALYLMRWTPSPRSDRGGRVTRSVRAWLLLGLSDVAHDFLQKTIGLVVHVCLAIVVLQKRVTVRNWLESASGRHRIHRQDAQPAGGGLALDRAVFPDSDLARLRNRVAARLRGGLALLPRDGGAAHRHAPHAAAAARGARPSPRGLSRRPFASTRSWMRGFVRIIRSSPAHCANASIFSACSACCNSTA